MKHKMKRTFAILLLFCIYILGGCAQNQGEYATPSVPDLNDSLLFSVPKRLTLTSAEEIAAYANGSGAYGDYVAHENFVTLEQIEHLGTFKDGISHFGTDLRHYGTVYSYSDLVDANGFAFEVVIIHVGGIDEGLSGNFANKLRIPIGTKSMAQINVDGVGHVRSSDFYYRYVNGKLGSIIASVDGVVFIIKPSTEFSEYPDDGERTFISLLLSTSSWDHWAAMRMLQRCFPKTWVHYAVYCGIALVAVAAALGVFFVIRARRAKRKEEPL